MNEEMQDNYTGSNLIFILGCGRSGTTWAQQLLASHPKVRTGQESYLFSRYVGPQLRVWKSEMRKVNERTFWDGLGCYFLDNQYRMILRDYMMKLLTPMISELPPGHFFVDKTPNHALWIREIVEMLPDCRIIHVERDGRDVVASLLAASKSFGSAWAPRYPIGAARLWKDNIEAVRKASKALTKENFLEIRYENLKSSPSSVLREIAEFIGLSWTDQEVAAAIKSNDAATGLKEATKIPLSGEVGRLHGSILQHPEGFVRKAKSGSWKEDMGFFAKMEVWWVIHKLMDQEGYQWPYPWF